MPRAAGNSSTWTELYLKAHKAKYHRQLKAVHPDLNRSPEAHEKTVQLTRARGRIPVIPLRIEVGFRVKYAGRWWEVFKMSGGRLWLLRRNRYGEDIRINVYQRDVEDVRCGPNFRYVMVELF